MGDLPEYRDPYDDRLARIFDEMRGSLREGLSASEYAALRDAFVFHMTDWLEDGDRFAALRREPRSAGQEEAIDRVVGFLIHAIPHLRAASRILLDDVGDPFEGDETDQLLAKSR